VGFSPIAMEKNALGTTLAVERYGSAFFKNGAQPAGVLEHPGVLKDPQKIRDNWMNAYGGAGNAHKVAVLEEGMQYKPISLPPEDSQFLSTREFGVEEICRMFQVPPHLVQDLKRSTFNNIEHQGIAFVQYSLMPAGGRAGHLFSEVQCGRPHEGRLQEPYGRLRHWRGERLFLPERRAQAGKHGPDPGGRGR
jgi:HK97 family phage portal protein